MVELNTLSPKKWEGNYGGIAPTLDSSNGVRIGDLALDLGFDGAICWLCQSNASGNPTWIDVSSLAAGGAVTGLTHGGILSVNVDNTKFDVSEGHGYIVDAHTDPDNPVVTRIKWNAFSAESTPYLATHVRTEVYIDINGDLLLQSDLPTPEDLRDYIYLGRLVHNNLTNIIYTLTTPRLTFNKMLYTSDLAYSLGVINVSGNTYAANGANLKLDKASGETFKSGINYENSYKNPNIIADNALSQLEFRYRYRNNVGGFTTTGVLTDVDPSHYDDGTGTLADVSNNKFTIQRIYYFPKTENTYLTYGQTIYDTITAAKNAVGIDNPVLDTVFLQDASFRSFLIIQEGATDLSDTSQADFVTLGKLGDVTSGGGGGGGDVTGPSSATDNALARFDGTSGKVIQDNANSTVDDNGNATFAGKVIGRSNVSSITTTYTARITDNILLANSSAATFTITLPAVATSTGVHYYIKKVDDSLNPIVVDGNSSELIDGLTSQNVSGQYTCMEIVCDGAKWNII